VLDSPNIRFYAGAPLTVSDGSCVGTLCIIDHRPRETSQAELQMLRDLGDWVQEEINLLDIGEATKIIRDQEIRLRAIMGNILDGIITIDKTGIVESFNAAAQRIFDYAAHEVIGKNVAMLMPDPHRQRHDEYLADYLETGDTKVIGTGREVVGVRKDGTPFPMDLSVSTMELDDGLKFIGIVRDITVQKRAQEALKDSEVRFRTLVEHAPEAIVVLDADSGHFADVNENAARLFGYSSADLYRLGLLALSPPKQADGQSSHELIAAYVQQALNGEEPVFEWAHRNAAGRNIPCEVRLVRFPASGCNLVRGSITDITERKRSEEALQKSNMLMNSISLAQSRYLIDSSEEYVFEQLLKDLLAITESEYGFIGEILHTVTGDPYLKTHAITNIAWSEQTRKFSVKNAPNGLEFHNLNTLFGNVITTRRPVISNNPAADSRRGGLPAGHPELKTFLGVPFLLGTEILGMAGIANRPRGYDEELVDFLGPFISTLASLIQAKKADRERSRTEAALRESDQRWQFALEGSQDGIWDWNLQTDEVFFSKRWKEMLGFQDNEISNELKEWSERLHPDDQEQVYADLEKHLNGHTEYYVNEHRVKCKDNTYKWILDRGKAIERDEQGKALRVIGTHTDITSRKHAEQELKQAKEAAEAAARAKSEFLATMSHEIRTPMNGVLGMAELMRDTQLSEEQQEYLKIINQSGRALLTVINDILDFSKVEAGKLELEPIAFDLEAAARDVMQLLIAKAEEAGLELVLDYAADCPRHLVGDAGRTRQILLNLVNNAIKFTEKGHVLTTIDCVRQHEQTVQVRIGVTDTGIGITSDDRAKLFRSFTQADASTTRRFGGTGLGLAISKHLVELMGGEIGVDSTPGEGSTFWLTLSLPVAAAPEPPAMAQLQGLRALVVDDSPINQRVLKAQLESFQMEVDVSGEAEQAMSQLSAISPTDPLYDLIVLDHQLPGMDGEQFACLLQQHPRLARIPMVLLTSVGQMGDVRRFKEAGFAAYLTKPVETQLLRQTLASVLHGQERDTNEPPITQHQPAQSNKPAGRRLPQFSGRILLVEDVPANQKVALSMLKKLGLRPDVATTGKEAVEISQQADYDLIFMDCQMPEMDGYEATAAIRACERMQGRHVPIIALTANALNDERQRCLQSGMDDYISKPFERDHLMSALLQWLSPSPDSDRQTQAQLSTEGIANPGNSTAPAVIDRERLNAMRETLGEDFQDMLATYLEGAVSALAQMTTAHGSANTCELERMSHNLKSTSVHVGALRLSDLACRLENQIKQGDLVAIEPGIRALRTEFERVYDALASDGSVLGS
jgi:PAS domain S-box-containing protein